MDIKIRLHNFEALLTALSVQPTFINKIKASQVNDLERIRKKVQSIMAPDFRIHDYRSLRFGNRLCAPNDVKLKREIIVHTHSGKRHTIFYHYGCYDPLQYPLLFPRGESGWHPHIKKFDKSNNDDANGENNNMFNHSTYESAEDIIQQETQGNFTILIFTSIDF